VFRFPSGLDLPTSFYLTSADAGTNLIPCFARPGNAPASVFIVTECG